MKALPFLASLGVTALCLALLVALRPPFSEVPTESASSEKRWFKGNTHTHSLWSDGNDFPEMIADWYQSNGYQFLVLSDHNILSRDARWMRIDAVEKRRKTLGHSTLEKYQKRFGDGVELRGEGELREVRLKTLAEIRPLFEKPGSFLMIEGEEVSDGISNIPVHINAINVGELIPRQRGSSVPDIIRHTMRAAQEQAERLNREILLHINHPNFGWAFTAQDLAAVLEEEFFEVYNGHPAINHLGDDTRPGDEKLWDLANAIRIGQLQGPPLLGVATDDSHHYHGGEVSPGRGWIMVRAERLQAEALIKAMKAGDFYASTGVLLKEVTFDRQRGLYRVEVEPREGEQIEIQFIGTLKSDAPEDAGRLLKTVQGNSGNYEISGDELYVRATITSNRSHPNPSFPDQKEQAWAQPSLP